ncbi:hypothetical protein [Sodalis praecaptivus]|uniref:hypothetical protein n=1 Tax=Sodalis TaxID=84565 RepID=UPI00046D719D|nr:hypothetical protein [Sodalis praecaptivus]
MGKSKQKKQRVFIANELNTDAFPIPCWGVGAIMAMFRVSGKGRYRFPKAFAEILFIAPASGDAHDPIARRGSSR